MHWETSKNKLENCYNYMKNHGDIYKKPATIYEKICKNLI